jgi:hypothetical protein
MWIAVHKHGCARICWSLLCVPLWVILHSCRHLRIIARNYTFMWLWYRPATHLNVKWCGLIELMLQTDAIMNCGKLTH